MPPQFNTEDLRKALDRYSEYEENNPYSQDDAREYLFERARDEGFLDNYVQELLEERGYEADDDFDSSSIDSYDIEYGRDRLDVSDFPDAIPVSEQYRVDPDLEEYNVYNFVNENPKARQFFTDQTINLQGTDAQNRFLRSLRAGSFTPQQLNTLRQVRFAGNSNVLENFSDEDFAFETADAINREATGRDVAPLRPIYENTAEALNQIQGLESVASNLREYTEDLRDIRSRLNSAESQPSRPLDSSFSSDTRQTTLPITFNDNDQVERLRTRLNSLPTSLNTVNELAEARNNLYGLQRDLRSVLSARQNPNEAIRTNLRATVLPQVEAFLGPTETNRAIDNAYRLQAEDRLQARDDARERSDYFRLLRQQDAGTRRPEFIVSRDTSPLSLSNSEGMRPIPGLNELLNADRFNKVKTILSQYPEVESILETSIKDTQRKPIRGQEAKQYMPFIDTEQVISMPVDRKNIYNDMLKNLPEFVEDPERGRNFIKDIEVLYTSGNTEKQKIALNSLDAFGYGDALRGISAPAISSSRPIVGGGRYVSTSNLTDKADTEPLASRIKTRSEELDRAFSSLSSDELRQMYPNYFDRPSVERKLEINYDPDTNTVKPVAPGDTNVYGISISTGNPIFNSRAALNELPDNISLNALRFLADNPILGSTSVAFTTKAPGRGSGYDMEPKNLPSAVSDAFSRFAQSTALEGLPPGTLVTNSPLPSSDLLRKKLAEGFDESTSSTVRKLQPFADEGQTLPNLRGAAYQSAGFGPYGRGRQVAYIDAQGRVVPLQLTKPEPGLEGRLDIREDEIRVPQNRLPLSSKAYYSVNPVSAALTGAQELGRGVRRAPASLLPGVADLIPSPEAIQTGYQRGPVEMSKQMATEFVQSLPTAAAAAGVLSTPVAAPFAPGIGAGLVGTAAARALNEVVRQQTGEGIIPKLRQAIGTEPRTGVAAPQRTAPYITPQIRPLTSAQKAEMNRQQNQNELQRRVNLVRERFNPVKGEFGISELLFGR